MKDEIDKVDNIDRKDLLSKKEKNIKDRIPCLITYNRKLPMMRKIINKHWNVLQINPGLEETFYEFIRSKMEMCLKPIQEKENVNLATQVNHHYAANRLLALVHDLLNWNVHYSKSNMLEKLKQLLTED